MANRLAASTSPYLLQHADNPVDWWEWGEDAFAEAKRRDVPVLLSVGYSACHWCHVMAHESFEDAETAAVINDLYVAVKVDREERPDIDAVYMQATTALTGHGGWPMTCLLTPTGEPFFAGTYFPKAHLTHLLKLASQTWTTRRDEVLASSSHVAETLRNATEPPTPSTLDDAALQQATSTLMREFDWEYSGFGGAPKFPPSMVLEFLLRHHARTGSAPALRMTESTCEAMARGGMYDQLDGGFARYSVDAAWVVPHFEKMLYDNAQLLRVYVHLWRLTGSDLARRVAEETADFLMRRLRTEHGAFASALDADTEGVEGATYAWTPQQLVDVLGDEAGAVAAELLTVTSDGTFEHGMSTLQLPADPTEPDWWRKARATLREARDQRPQPARDDKVVTSWNGLTIAALAEAGMLLRQPELLEAARACAEHLLTTHLIDRRLRRASRDGVVGHAAGVADDYGNFAEGLLMLHQADGSPRWLGAASSLLDTAIDLFLSEDGGFFDTAHDAEALFTRPRNPGDNAEPSGQSALAMALITSAALTGDNTHREVAVQALGQSGAVADRDPRFAGWALAAAEGVADGPVQIAIAVDADDVASGDDMARAAWLSPSPGAVRVVGRTSHPGIPLLDGREARDGQPTAYICKGFVCDRPETDLVSVIRRLGVRPAG